MRLKTTFPLVVLVLLAIAIVASSCGGSTTTTSAAASPSTTGAVGSSTTGAAATGEPIKIGDIVPLSGAEAQDGTRIRQAAELAVQQINGAGGINGRPIELVFEDGQGDPTASSAAAVKLVTQDKVVALLGAYESSATAAVMPIAAQYEIPLVTALSWDESLTQQGNKWFFRAAVTQQLAQVKLAPWFAKNLSIKKAAGICADTTGERIFGEIYQKELPKYGVEFTSLNLFPPGQTDLSSIITKVQNEGVDTIFMGMNDSDGLNLLKQLYSAGYKGNKVAFELLEDWLKLTPQGSEGMYATTWYWPQEDTPVNKVFAPAYKAAYGQDPDFPPAGGYDEVLIIADALTRAGSLDGAAIRDALKTTDMQITRGRLVFDETGQGSHDIGIDKVENGQRTLQELVDLSTIQSK
ncbi:MAG: ABC transporter substrate-binding protein [Actinobacteria bacterium]|nr:ABC transporter substrate-binding protein [Actinomycetota bacterium]